VDLHAFLVNILFFGVFFLIYLELKAASKLKLGLFLLVAVVWAVTKTYFAGVLERAEYFPITICLLCLVVVFHFVRHTRYRKR